MKISRKTLAAARKAADDQGMSLDAWADKVLAEAAAASRSPDVMTLLREILERIDQVAGRQSLAERANEQLAATIEEVGKSYAVARRTTGQFLGGVATRTSSAIDEVRERARELIIGRPPDPPAEADATAAAPPAEAHPAKRTRTPRKLAGTPRRAGARSKRTARAATARTRRRK